MGGAFLAVAGLTGYEELQHDLGSASFHPLELRACCEKFPLLKRWGRQVGDSEHLLPSVMSHKCHSVERLWQLLHGRNKWDCCIVAVFGVAQEVVADFYFSGCLICFCFWRFLLFFIFTLLIRNFSLEASKLCMSIGFLKKL